MLGGMASLPESRRAQLPSSKVNGVMQRTNLYVHLEPGFKEEAETFLTGFTPPRGEFICLKEARGRCAYDAGRTPQKVCREESR